MSVVKEFKEFAMKGNVVDMATGVVIGGAFGKIITSLVNDIIMPLISTITGKVDFKDLFISLDGKSYDTLDMAQKVRAATLNYGLFITNIIDFLIIAFSKFIVIKQVNRFRPKPVAVPASSKTCPYCLSSVNINAVKCPHCTSDIAGTETV
jgi:large conductance mechanosensitive channel